MRRLMDRLALSLLLIPLFVAGCRQQKPAVDFDQPLPPGTLALRKLSPGEYPDFSRCTWNLGLLPRSIDASIKYLGHPSSRQFFPYMDITHERAVATLLAFRDVIAAATGRSDAGPFIDQQIRERFEVYKSIGAPRTGGDGYTERVLFTGYYTPIFDASPTPVGDFRWPVYRRPPDLVTDDMGRTLGRRTPEGQIVPYWTRRQIEAEGRLAGHELLYLNSRWAAYVVTVQGSAKLRMPDGSMKEIGFAGHNGHEYTSPGRRMVADGVIEARSLNFRTLSNYFAAHPDAMDRYLWLNDRTVFFTERPGGPFGALNVPVTQFASIATDKNDLPNAYPRAMPAFLSVPIPRTDNPAQNWHFTGFMMDQDSGGAIRASGRCDIYMGEGAAGEQLAGHQLNEGELYYIALKHELVAGYLARQSTN
jgi:membrane-bound lytic murein transglycosylase A